MSTNKFFRKGYIYDYFDMGQSPNRAVSSVMVLDECPDSSGRYWVLTSAGTVEQWILSEAYRREVGSWSDLGA